MATSLTMDQWQAARMLLARLRSEAAHEDLHFEELGITWLAPDDLICATTDAGHVIRMGDLVLAALVLLWSQVLDTADIEGVGPEVVIARLGLGLLSMEPA